MRLLTMYGSESPMSPCTLPTWVSLQQYGTKGSQHSTSLGALHPRHPLSCLAEYQYHRKSGAPPRSAKAAVAASTPSVVMALVP